MDPRKGLRPKVSLIKADDVPRAVLNRRDKRALAKALRRLRSPRTGRPWPMVRKTGTPEHFGRWHLEGLMRELRARGIDVHDTLPAGITEEAA